MPIAVRLIATTVRVIPGTAPLTRSTALPTPIRDPAKATLHPLIASALRPTHLALRLTAVSIRPIPMSIPLQTLDSRLTPLCPTLPRFSNVWTGLLSAVIRARAAVARTGNVIPRMRTGRKSLPLVIRRSVAANVGIRTGGGRLSKFGRRMDIAINRSVVAITRPSIAIGQLPNVATKTLVRASPSWE
jgi:hypothetical protein